ncbi:MAG: hypothetical protein GC181_08205 [Bacteroidetes bacterium]|nr:hypothetical protein [Bacteroidota bacterium]
MKLTEMSAAPSKVAKGFYAFHKTGVSIEQLCKMLTADCVDSRFGLQSYKKYPIDYSTSFYNQPADIFHFILTTPDKRSFEVEFPGTDFNLNLQDSTLHLSVDFPDEENFIRMKEFTSKGGIVFAANFTVADLPRPCGINRVEFEKTVNKIRKRQAAFRKKKK